MSDKLGKLHFWLMIIGMLALTLLMMYSGLQGMRRRIADYDIALGIDIYHLWMTISAFIIATSVLVFFYNLIHSIRHGEISHGKCMEFPIAGVAGSIANACS